MPLGWGQGKIEVIKRRQEILDFLASGMTESAIFRLLQAQGLKGHKATFHRAIRKIKAEEQAQASASPSPVDNTPHYSPVSGVALQTRAARKPRVVKQPASLITTTAPTAPVPEGPSPEQEETRSSLTGMVFSKGKPGDGAGTW